jgi:PAS domain-containing protein
LGTSLTNKGSRARYSEKEVAGACVHKVCGRPCGLSEAIGNVVINILAGIGREKRGRILRAREKRLRVLAETAFQCGIISEVSTIIEANGAILAMFGYEKRKAIGRSALLFVASEHRDRTQRNVPSVHQEPYETVDKKRTEIVLT